VDEIMRIVVQDSPFDAGHELEFFRNRQDNIGAIVMFSGIVRDTPAKDLEALVIEHYPEMTESTLKDMAAQAIDRWSLNDVCIIHRVGRLVPRDPIMMVATAATHRRAAFESADFLMDYLKSRAPFWKKELTAHGSSWVSANVEDEATLNRWQTN